MKDTTLKIIDLTSANNTAIEQVAELLVAGFSGTGSGSWQNVGEAREEVMASLQPGRISRIATDEHGTVLGWIGGFAEHGGKVWELHPLVVRQDTQNSGVGRQLVADFERQVAERGGLSVKLGTDDENGRTSLGGVDLYPDVLAKLQAIENVGDHPFSFYLKVGYHIVGVIPDANGYGKPDILMAKRLPKE